MIEDPSSYESVYKLLVQNSLGLMCIHDLNGVLLSVNPAVAASLGYPPDQGPGRNLRDFLVPAVRHLFDDYLRRIRRNEQDSGLMRLQARDGSERVWMYRNVLNVQAARAIGDERHLCPLQLDVIERALIMWSNPGDVVLSPFMGIGSEGVVSLQRGRKFFGTGLKESYWRQACKNLDAIDRQAAFSFAAE